MATQFDRKAEQMAENGVMPSIFQPGANGMSVYAHNKITEFYQQALQQSQPSSAQQDMALVS